MAEVKKRSVPVKRASNIVSIGQNEKREISTSSYAVYTNMYKQHPIVRATIDKIAKTAVATGFQFIPRNSVDEPNEAAVAQLQTMFARSRSQYLLRQTFTDLLIYGDAYWYITKSRLGVPYQFGRVAPASVTVVVNEDTGEAASYIVRASDGAETQYKPEEFVHFKIYDPDNDVYGLSPLESLKSTVAQDLFAQTYNESFFANSAQTGIVFNMKNASKEEVERNREFLKKEYTSPANAHKPLLLEGDVDVSKSVASPAEMQFIEGRRALTMEILSVFDLPYTKLGGTSESANRSQSAENDKTFRSETIVPIQGVVEEAVNEQVLFTLLGIEDTVFAFRDVDTRDEQTKMNLYLDGLKSGIYSIDWVRGQLGLPAIDGGDEPFIQTPLGLIPVSRLADAANAVIDSKMPPQMAPNNQPNATDQQPSTGGSTNG